MSTDNILIKGCELCSIFLEPNSNIKTKLYYKESEDIKESEFVILECNTCKTPMVVVRDHVNDISKETWGHILAVVRKEFGRSTRLRLERRTIKDHWHAHIEV